MNDFNIAKIMLNKIRPRMYDEDWINANKLLGVLSKKSVQNRERKEAKFCYLVDKIYEKEDE